MNEIICMALGSIVTIILVGIIYMGYKFGPRIINYIKSVIRFNSNRNR